MTPCVIKIMVMPQLITFSKQIIVHQKIHYKLMYFAVGKVCCQTEENSARLFVNLNLPQKLFYDLGL